MRKHTDTLVVVFLAAASLGILFAGSLAQGRARGAERAALDSAHVALAAANARADSALDFAGQASSEAAFHASRASAYGQIAHNARLRADRLAGEASAATAAYRALAAAAPDTCRPALDAGDIALAKADSTADAFKHEADASTARAADLETALHKAEAARDSLRGAVVSLRAAAGQVDDAAATLARSTERTWRERLMPRPGVGVAAGVSPAGRFDVVTGPTLSWSF